MDLEKLKTRIREALGAAGIPREISAQIDQIIDSVSGGKKDEPKDAPKAEPARFVHEEDDDDEDEHRAPAKMAVKPARKTKTPRKKK